MGTNLHLQLILLFEFGAQITCSIIVAGSLVPRLHLPVGAYDVDFAYLKVHRGMRQSLIDVCCVFDVLFELFMET